MTSGKLGRPRKCIDEFYHLCDFTTREQARVASVGYVEGYYNRHRPHFTIDYQIPGEMMDSSFARFNAMMERQLPLVA